MLVASASKVRTRILPVSKVRWARLFLSVSQNPELVIGPVEGRCSYSPCWQERAPGPSPMRGSEILDESSMIFSERRTIDGAFSCRFLATQTLYNPAGKTKTKRVPDPGVDSIETAPSWSWVVFNTFASPSPVPLSTSFVVKKGSNIRSRTAGGIPLPVSAKVRSTYSPGKISWRVCVKDESASKLDVLM